MFKKQRLFYSWDEFNNDINKICDYINEKVSNPFGIYGVPKGGLPLATAVANHLGLRLFLNLDEFYGHMSFVSCYKPYDENKMIIVDDIVDSGDTMKNLPDNKHTKKISLFHKEGAKFIPDFFCNKCKKREFVIFPWEPKDKIMKRDRDG